MCAPISIGQAAAVRAATMRDYCGTMRAGCFAGELFRVVRGIITHLMGGGEERVYTHRYVGSSNCVAEQYFAATVYAVLCCWPKFAVLLSRSSIGVLATHLRAHFRTPQRKTLTTTTRAVCDVNARARARSRVAEK